jgi:hypothetical protein
VEAAMKFVPKSFAVSLLLAVPVFAWGQHHGSSGGGGSHPSAPSHASAPAQHASAPHTSAPAHNSTQSRPNTMSRPGGSTAGHSNTGMAGHTNTTAGAHTNTAGHTNTGMAGRNNTTAGHGNTTAGHGNTTAGHGNTTAGHGNTNAGRGNTNAGHGNNNAGHGNTNARMNHTPPGRNVSLKGGGSAHIRPNGQIRSVNRNGMHIEHNMHGGRTIVRERNGARIVSTGRHGGYVQRAYVTRGGRSYYSRTYYYHGVYRTGVYRGYYYGGYNYYGYYHPYYYGPAYYGWAYNPWPAPVYYGWGWGGAPWYGYYGAYWNPYPVYPTAAFWLTDYLIAANLQAAYAAQAEAASEAGAASNGGGSGNGGGDDNQVASTNGGASSGDNQVQLTPEVKQAIAEEVKAQIAAAQSEAGKSGGSSGGGQSPAPASGEVPPALDPAHRTFVVSADLAVVADGQECSLTQGDVITRLTDTPDDEQKVNVSVASSKKTDCAAGKQVAVGVDDLQEMHNHFQEQIDEGLKSLASKQGTGGLPKSPDTTTVASDVPPPAPDKSVEKTLADQDADADKTEADVKQEAAANSSGGQY